MTTELISQQTAKTVYHLTKKQLQSIPVVKTVKNPYYSKAPPTKLYSKEVIEEFVNTDVFKESWVKRQKLIAAGKKVADKKREQTKEGIRNLLAEIQLERIPFTELRSKTLESQREWYDYKGYSDNVYNADELTVRRWMVNYLRHELIEQYEEGCLSLYKKVGKSEAYEMLRNTVLEIIRQVYPELSSEVDNQKRRHELYADIQQNQL